MRIFFSTHVKHMMLIRRILHLHNLLFRRSSNLTLFPLCFFFFIFHFYFHFVCLHQRGFCPLLLTQSARSWSLGVPFLSRWNGLVCFYPGLLLQRVGYVGQARKPPIIFFCLKVLLLSFSCSYSQYWFR